MQQFVCVLLAVAVSFGRVALAQEEDTLTWRDDFAQYAARSTGAPNWTGDGFVWSVEGGKYRGSWMTSVTSLVARPELYRDLRAEVRVTPNKALGKSWKIAALALYEDTQNFWHLGLVEKPEDSGNGHFVELCEMREGRWLSQTNLKRTAADGTAFDWQYGTTYLLKLALSPKGIEGTVNSLSGECFARIAFAFTDVAVKQVRPGLRVSIMDATFDDFAMEADRRGMRAIPPPDEKVIPPYAVSGSGVKAPGEATGFFRTVLVDGRWWLADPRGELFYAVGTDHVNYFTHWCQELGYAPYNRSCEAKYGSIDVWAETATARLRDWGFNLLGANNVPQVRYKGLAHTLFASFGSTFSGHSALVEKVHWTGLPNVFHPRWESFCRMKAKQTCQEHRGDPWLLGYFLDNELEWYGKTRREEGIFIETMKLLADHSGKRALVDVLREHHGTIAVFNDAWGQAVSGWDDVLALTKLVAENDRSREAQLAFLRRVADRYFSVTTAAIRVVDPDHLIIGSRFAGNAPEWAWKACAKYCDVVTFNHYPRIDFESGDLSHLAERFREYYDLVERPMMITEWSFPALDSGLPCKHGAGMRVDTQDQKARCFELMQHLLFRLPFMVGSDYFMWADEPELGISDTFPEDSNYGLVNVHDEPYPELTSACRKLNPKALAIHAGEVPEAYIRDVSWKDGAVAVTVENWSSRELTVPLRLEAGPSVSQLRIRLPGASLAEADPADPLARPPAVGTIALSVPDAPAGLPVRVEIAASPAWPAGCRGRRQVVTVLQSGGTGVAGGKGMLAIVNPTRVPLHGVPIIVPGLDQPAQGDGSLVFRPTDTSLAPVSVQRLDDGRLTLVASHIPATGTLAGQLLPASRDDAAAARPAGLRVEKLAGGGYRIDNGVLVLEHDGESGNIIDRILCGDTLMGSYNPLVWQRPVDNQWTQAGRCVEIKVHQGSVAVCIEVIAEGGPDVAAITTVDEDGQLAAKEGRATAFRVAHEIIVWPGVPYFLARLRWIRNVDTTQPLTICGYFFYLQSAIGGDRAGDTPGAHGGVPNYYRSARQVHWFDEAVGGRYGCSPADESGRMKTTFWLDNGGGQHPDARVECDPVIVLGPGQKYVPEDPPELAIFAVAREGKVSWADLEAALAARKKLIAVAAPR